MIFRARSTETAPNVTGLRLFDVFIAPIYLFLITNMHVANKRVFSVMYSCCCFTGLGLGLNILVLVPLLLNAASKRISTNFHSRPSHKRCPRLRFVSDQSPVHTGRL